MSCAFLNLHAIVGKLGNRADSSIAPTVATTCSALVPPGLGGPVTCTEYLYAENYLTDASTTTSNSTPRYVVRTKSSKASLLARAEDVGNRTEARGLVC
jgi:hypothetical protein